jgi:dTDP-4-amino-4,6-dideoxygalactose transaminase
MGELRERTDKRLGPHAEPAYHKIYPGTHYSRDYVDAPLEFGTNYRMGELQGALGLVQLGKLARLNNGRRRIAARLNAGLAGVPGITLQHEKPYAHHIYHLYTIFYHPEIVGVPKDDFIRYLEEEGGIQVVIRYFPVHLSPELRAFGHQYGECPVAERVFFEHQIQLPIYNHLTDAQVDHVIETVTQAVARLQRGAAAASR